MTATTDEPGLRDRLIAELDALTPITSGKENVHVGWALPDWLFARLRAALATTPAASDGSLDVAWAAAEAAMPEGCHLVLRDTGPHGPFNPGPEHEFGANRYIASAKLGISSGAVAATGSSEDSPAAALHALVAKLRGST